MMGSQNAQWKNRLRSLQPTRPKQALGAALSMPPPSFLLPRYFCTFSTPRWQNTCLALVEAVDDAAQGTADVSLGSIGVVEEFNTEGQRVLAQVKALDESVAGQVPHIQAAPKDP